MSYRSAMKRLALLLLFAGCATATRPSPRDVVDRFLTGLAANDAQVVMSTFAEDATVFFPMNDKPLLADGKEAIARVFNELLHYPPGPKLVPQDVRVTVEGHLALVTFQIANPNVVSRRTFVLREEGGRWLILHLHGSNIRA